MKKLLIILTLAVSFISLIPMYTYAEAPVSNTERGIVVRAALEKSSGKTIGTYRALLIGINDYKDNKIPTLNTAVNDVKVLSNILKKDYSFKEVTLLLDSNASSSNIIKLLRHLATTSNEDDSVLIYYAGHGELDKITGSGWWIPYDARAQDPSTYIDNSVIQKYIKAIPARHVLLVVDSCFSGTLFGEARSLPPVIDDKFYATLYKKRSRWGMTSGNLTPVSDSGSEGHSIFAYQFIEALKENKKPYLTPREIYQQIGPIVRNNSEQMPITKPIRNADDQGGEFIFLRATNLSSKGKTDYRDLDLEKEKKTSKTIHTSAPEEKKHQKVKDSNDMEDELAEMQKQLNSQVMSMPFLAERPEVVDAYIKKAMKKNLTPPPYTGRYWRRGYTCRNLLRHSWVEYRNCRYYYRYHGRYYPY